jgi:hypothetical protein
MNSGVLDSTKAKLFLVTKSTSGLNKSKRRKEPFNNTPNNNNVFSALQIREQPNTSEVVLEDSETLKVARGESSHGEVTNIKDNSGSSNNFRTNNSHTDFINNNILVSNNANSNKNLTSNKNTNIINSSDSSKCPPSPLQR